MKQDILSPKVCFNPRTRTGCDFRVRPLFWDIHDVSTHAPALGATATLRLSTKRALCFNPRTRTGCDACLRPWHDVCMFQPTHPHGVRRDVGVTTPWSSGFNPRTRTGCDPYVEHYLLFLSVSTHAPARGATCRLMAQSVLRCGFQPTHPHGVRRMTVRIHTGATVSTHAPARGATRTFLRILRPELVVSTHAPARGATVHSVGFSLPRSCFNPRTRTGCDQIHPLSCDMA